MLAVALALYGPAMRLGLLSDDFALLAWARQGEFLPGNWEYVRPVPLVMWAAVAAIVPTPDAPAALHFLNIAAHAVSAWLVFLLAGRFGCSTGAAALAGGLFLLYPTAVEPVVWPTAIFDLTIAIGLLLLALLVTSDVRLTRGQIATGLLLGALMLGTKETAVATAPLVALVVATRWGKHGRDGYWLAGGIAVLTVIYLMWRFGADRLTSPPAHFGPGVIRTLLLDPFIALLLPFHENVRQAHPALTWLFGLTILGVVLLRLLLPADARFMRRLDGFAASWVMVSASPLLGMFVVGADLQGARYVYVPACVWTMAVAAALVDGWKHSSSRVAGWVIASTLLAGMAAASNAHLAPWREAARVRDAVVVALARLPETCGAVYLEGVPDNVEGASVFRNGLIQALGERGRTFEVVHAREDAAPECRVSFFNFEQPLEPSSR